MTKLLSPVNPTHLIADEIVTPQQLKLGDVFSFEHADRHIGKTGKEFYEEIADLFQVNRVATSLGNGTSFSIGFHRLSSRGEPSGNYACYTILCNVKLRKFTELSEELRNQIKMSKIVLEIKELNTRYDNRKLRNQEGEVPKVHANG